MYRFAWNLVLVAAGVAVWCRPAAGNGQGKYAVRGELRKWHRVTITFDGPSCREEGNPNPFLDFRLTVEFRNGSRRYVVPGFFAADGDAAQTGATAGNKWRVHFTPDATGVWRFTARFRSGKNVAIDPAPDAGKPVAFDGVSGSFRILPSDKRGRDHRAQGRLQYIGQRYLRFAESKRYFLKGGADSPENFLAFADFDGTKPTHRYQPHLRDWRPGDPTWRGGKGKGIIGAINYLSSQGMNSVYFLTMNVGGDGKDVWPWISPKARTRFDCSKLDQWEIVFSHMDARGVLLHVVTQETENDQLLDGGELGLERKLYLRELIARFSHHLALIWNLGEENTNTLEQRRQFCRYIRGLDPYDHPIVCHTFPGKYDSVYTPLLGFPYFDGVSLQTNDTYRQTLRWVTKSQAAGRPWVVCLDEIGPAQVGVKPDRVDPTHDEVRKRHLWGNLMAGGGGVEWYFGYKYPDNDLNCEDWRSRHEMWRQTRIALEFFQRYVPFSRTRPMAESVKGDGALCLAEPGRTYVVYLARGGEARVRLQKGQYRLRWYNPRAGGELIAAPPITCDGSQWTTLRPPTKGDQDWTALIERLTK